jgi:hypothetical protein
VDLSLFALAASLAMLQIPAPPRASIAGTVRDGETGAPLPGAAVALSDLSRNATADADGRYLLTDVPPGPQHLTVRYIGYAPRVLHALVPSQGRLDIDLSLRATPLRLQPLVAHPAVAMRGLEHESVAYPDRAVSLAAIRTDPLLAEPDALEALGGGEVVLAAESPNGMHVRGGAADQTAFQLDGVPVLSPYHAAGLFSAWNPDALAQVTLRSSGLPDGESDALSGAVSAETRDPGSRIEMQGALTTTQGRLTVAGPIRAGDAGYVISLRSGFRSGWPGGIGSEAEPDLLRGSTRDRLAALTLKALGGRLRLLGYANDNDLNSAAVAAGEVGDRALRNRFEWQSQSLGGEWRRELGAAEVRVAVWRATSDASASWLAPGGGLGLTSLRRDLGAVAAVEQRTAGGRNELGLRMERRRTGYAIVPDSAGAAYELASTTPVATLFGRYARGIGTRLDLELGASVVAGGGATALDPAAELRWRAADGFVLSATYARRHQLTQSLRNPESIVGNVFPADLPAGAGAAGVPVGRSDLGLVAVELRPSGGVRVAAQAYLRGLDGLVLAAPATGEPFAVAGFATGGGEARGVSIETSLAAARYAVRASYAFQHVRFRAGDTRYAPAFASAHLLDAGLVLFPTPTLVIRVAGSAAAGRRGTAIPDAVEWESCNLRDHGCELAGSPHYEGAALGGAALPPYVSLELGVRKHWHIAVGGRDAVLGLFGTLTNLLGRGNVLTYAGDPAAGPPAPVELRPRSPLVVGMDWQF